MTEIICHETLQLIPFSSSSHISHHTKISSRNFIFLLFEFVNCNFLIPSTVNTTNHTPRGNMRGRMNRREREALGFFREREIARQWRGKGSRKRRDDSARIGDGTLMEAGARGGGRRGMWVGCGSYVFSRAPSSPFSTSSEIPFRRSSSRSLIDRCVLRPSTFSWVYASSPIWLDGPPIWVFASSSIWVFASSPHKVHGEGYRSKQITRKKGSWRRVLATFSSLRIRGA